MIEQPFSNEVALRIGLAARQIPNIELVALIEALHHILGDDITEQNLTKVTVTNLKGGFNQSHDVDGDDDRENFTAASMAGFKEAVRILWGETDEAEIPSVTPYKEGDMPGAVRVAVASNTGEEVDGHFGSALRFLIYMVSPQEIRLIEVRSAVETELAPEKIPARVELIEDCAVMYAVSIGGPAAARVGKSRIHIMVTPEGGAARTPLQKLQDLLAKKPPPWLAKRQCAG